MWPNFRDEWVIHDDGVLLVVDKPAGVPSQAADPKRPDDVVTRLRGFLASRDVEPYLGVHQRLDQPTSGVLVFAARKDANASLAAQFEGRGVEKTYVACVTGWPRGREKATLRDALAPGTDGNVRVAGPRDRGARAAVTHVRVLGRRADRTMLELSLETGRTHQARVQLAHARAPVAGDTLYGGATAPRLLLHASALSLQHPSTGRRVRFVAPPPAEFDAWLAHGDRGEAIFDDAGSLTRALARALERRWGLGRSGSTTAFRLVNEGRRPPEARRRRLRRLARRATLRRRRVSGVEGGWSRPGDRSLGGPPSPQSCPRRPPLPRLRRCVPQGAPAPGQRPRRHPP